LTGLFGLFFLYLKFPEEISNEQSATPKRKFIFPRSAGQADESDEE